MALRLETKQQKEIKIIYLLGNLDEDFSFNKLLSELSSKTILDLKNVKKITSYGVKQWITFQKNISDDIKIEYHNCSIVFVEQANMISNFIIHGKIKSFYAPYLCDKGHEYQQLLKVSELLKTEDDEFDMIYKKCEICGAKSELDDFPSDYFLFDE